MLVVELSMIAVTVRVSGAMVVDSAGMVSSKSICGDFHASVLRSIAAEVVDVDAAAGRAKAAAVRSAS